MTSHPDLLRQLLALPAAERVQVVQELAPDAAEALLYDWSLWARPNQLPPPGDWLIWLLLAGRGFGKTRTGAEFIRAEVAAGRMGRVALIAPTSADARDVMVEGESGLLAVHPPKERPVYEPTKRRVTWPNGAVATLFSADEPDRLRGPQFDGMWEDELAAWRYPEAHDLAMMALRLGQRPRCVITTTPRPTPIIKALLKSPTTVVTRGTTYDNIENLAPNFVAQVVERYRGTTLGRQELLAEVLDDNPAALWHRDALEACRVGVAPTLVRVVVAVDPEAANNEESAEAGIVVAGRGVDGHAYVLADDSLRGSPHQWGTVAVRAYVRHRADRLLAEVNNGGDMVEFVIRTINPMVAYKKLHASRGKQARAEPVAALYEQGLVHHVGTFPELEDQLCSWVPGEGKSPDRLDALVWAITDLMLGPQGRLAPVRMKFRRG